MIYCAILCTYGWHTICDALPAGNKWLALYGLVCYVGGMTCGEIHERRLIERIKNLEKELRKDV